MQYKEALQFARDAEADMAEQTYSVASSDVLRLVNETGHSAYDCEYVALAERLDSFLVTGDKQLCHLFPDTAILLEDFANR